MKIYASLECIHITHYTSDCDTLFSKSSINFEETPWYLGQVSSNYVNYFEIGPVFFSLKLPLSSLNYPLPWSISFKNVPLGDQSSILYNCKIKCTCGRFQFLSCKLQLLKEAFLRRSSHHSVPCDLVNWHQVRLKPKLIEKLLKTH